MFITRATRHDRADLDDFYARNEWEPVPAAGTSFLARDGGVVGAARLIEVAPQALVVEDAVVDRPRRREGIGTSVMRAAMNSRGGTLYLSCHPDALEFYGRLGFAEVDFESLPQPVAEYFRSTGDYPTKPGHVHHFMKAR